MRQYSRFSNGGTFWTKMSPASKIDLSRYFRVFGGAKESVNHCSFVVGYFVTLKACEFQTRMPLTGRSE